MSRQVQKLYFAALARAWVSVKLKCNAAAGNKPQHLKSESIFKDWRPALMRCEAGTCTSCRVSGTTWCGSVGRTHGSGSRTPGRRRGKIIVQVRNIITHKIIYGTNGEFARCGN